MNPLRALFLSLSRMPPAVMLLVIIGLAVVVTMMVTGKVSESEKTFEARKAELEQKANAKGRVVYTIKDIPEGQTIPSDALEEREIEQAKIPADAITSASLATGRVAKYGISTGQIVSQHDLAPQGISLGFESRLKEGMRAVTFGVDTRKPCRYYRYGWSGRRNKGLANPFGCGSNCRRANLSKGPRSSNRCSSQLGHCGCLTRRRHQAD